MHIPSELDKVRKGSSCLTFVFPRSLHGKANIWGGKLSTVLTSRVNFGVSITELS